MPSAYDKAPRRPNTHFHGGQNTEMGKDLETIEITHNPPAGSKDHTGRDHAVKKEGGA